MTKNKNIGVSFNSEYEVKKDHIIECTIENINQFINYFCNEQKLLPIQHYSENVYLHKNNGGISGI
jgi:hypothetical protein